MCNPCLCYSTVSVAVLQSIVQSCVSVWREGSREQQRWLSGPEWREGEMTSLLCSPSVGKDITHSTCVNMYISYDRSTFKFLNHFPVTCKCLSQWCAVRFILFHWSHLGTPPHPQHSFAQTILSYYVWLTATPGPAQFIFYFSFKLLHKRFTTTNIHYTGFAIWKIKNKKSLCPSSTRVKETEAFFTYTHRWHTHLLSVNSLQTIVCCSHTCESTRLRTRELEWSGLDHCSPLLDKSTVTVHVWKEFETLVH